MKLVEKSNSISLKRIFLCLFATFIVGIICYLTGRFFSFTSFTFAWVLNFMLMAWYTYLASNLNFRYNSNYFCSTPFEKGGRIYRYFKIDLYRKLLVKIGWEKITRKEYGNKNDLSSWKKREYNSRSSETGHTIIAFIVFILALTLTGTLAEAKWLLITNLFLNIYPVMLQRYNRPRYLRIIKSKMKINEKETRYS